MRSRAATTGVALLVMLAFGNSALNACEWSISAADRQACCIAAGHECDGSDADACCAKGQQGRHAQSPQQLAAMLAPSLHVISFVAPSAIPLRHMRRTSAPSLTKRNDAYLLLSVILV